MTIQSGVCCNVRWASRILILAMMLGMVPRVIHATPSCVGDCNADHSVMVNELIICVNIALDAQPPSNCVAGDDDMNGKVSVNEIIKGVNNVLAGCPTCGNRVVEASEDCDDGGTCIGGPDAGTQCSGDSDCSGSGVCIGGGREEYPCADDAACPDGRCRHCVPQGGDDCAANCTSEAVVTYMLKPGESADPTTCMPGTSCAGVHGDSLRVPLPLNGMQSLTLGKERDGLLPVIIRADSVKLPQIDGGGLVCACVRGVAVKTCGGTLYQADGTPSTNCTAGFTAGDSICPSEKPCVFVYGSGNSASGVVGCNTSAGSLLVSTAIGTMQGACRATFCTDSDPQSARGQVTTLPLTTGAAGCEFPDANGIPDNTICMCPDGLASCSTDSCLGPLTVTGSPVSCSALINGSASGTCLAGCVTIPEVSVVGDAVVTTELCLQ